MSILYTQFYSIHSDQSMPYKLILLFIKYFPVDFYVAKVYVGNKKGVDIKKYVLCMWFTLILIYFQPGQQNSSNNQELKVLFHKRMRRKQLGKANMYVSMYCTWCGKFTYMYHIGKQGRRAAVQSPKSRADYGIETRARKPSPLTPATSPLITAGEQHWQQILELSSLSKGHQI